jgi:ribosomal protein L37AE/L43A
MKLGLIVLCGVGICVVALVMAGRWVRKTCAKSPLPYYTCPRCGKQFVPRGESHLQTCSECGAFLNVSGVEPIRKVPNEAPKTAKFKVKKRGKCQGCGRKVALLGDLISGRDTSALEQVPLKMVGFRCGSCGEIICGACCFPRLVEKSGTTPALTECPKCKSRLDLAKAGGKK